MWLGSLPAKTRISAAVDALRTLDAGVEAVKEDEDGLYIAAVFPRQEEDAVSRALDKAAVTEDDSES